MNLEKKLEWCGLSRSVAGLLAIVLLATLAVPGGAVQSRSDGEQLVPFTRVPGLTLSFKSRLTAAKPGDKVHGSLAASMMTKTFDAYGGEYTLSGLTPRMELVVLVSKDTVSRTAAREAVDSFTNAAIDQGGEPTHRELDAWQKFQDEQRPAMKRLFPDRADFNAGFIVGVDTLGAGVVWGMNIEGRVVFVMLGATSENRDEPLARQQLLQIALNEFRAVLQSARIRR